MNDPDGLVGFIEPCLPSKVARPAGSDDVRSRG